MNAYDQVDTSAGLAIIFTFLMILVLFVKWNKAKRVLKPNIYFIAYYLFAVISVAWADWTQIPVAGYKAVEVLTSFCFIMLIMSKMKTIRQAFDFILVLCLFLNLIFLLGNPGHDNAFPLVGIVEFMLALGAIRYEISTRKKMIHHLIVGLLTIIISTSTASWLSLIIGLFVFFSTSTKGIKLTYVISAFIFFYGIFLFFGDYITSIIAAGHSEAELQSGTGRQQLWEAYIEGWKESPWVGHGFIVGEKGAVASQYVAFATNTAHNMMISVLVNTGIIGMMIWLRFLWKQCSACYKLSLKKNVFALTMFPALLAMFVNANSFPIIGSEWSPVSPPIYAMIVFVFTFMPKAINDEGYIAK